MQTGMVCQVAELRVVVFYSGIEIVERIASQHIHLKCTAVAGILRRGRFQFGILGKYGFCTVLAGKQRGGRCVLCSDDRSGHQSQSCHSKGSYTKVHYVG